MDKLLKQHKLDLIAVVRFLGVAFVHSDRSARARKSIFFILFSFLCSILNPLEDGFPMSYKKIMHF